MTSSGGPPGDVAAHALSSLSLNKDGEPRYDATHGSGEGPPSSYRPSIIAPNQNFSQGLPYLASPISGVVSGSPYILSSPSYTPYDSHGQNNPESDRSHAPPNRSSSGPVPGSYPPSTPYVSSYPPSAPYALNLPENLDVSSAGKQRGDESAYPRQYYSGAPAPNAEGYPPASSEYPPKFNDSNSGQSFSSFPTYGTTAPAPALPYPQPEGYDGQKKEKTKKESESAPPNYESSPSIPTPDFPQPGYPPDGSYPPVSGQRDPSAFSAGCPPQHTGEQHHSSTEYPAHNVLPGEHTTEANVSSSSGGDTDGEKGFKHGHHFGYGGYPQQGYAQPGYPQPGYPQPGYGQPMYPQPGYGAYPSHGVAPSYPPAYPGHGYAPEGYPSHSYGVPGYVQPYGYGGHGVPHHAPAPYGGHGVPHYGGHGHYKHHKGGYKGYKHKKMKKMKKGHYLHFQQPYGYSGGHYGGRYGKHGHRKHKH